MTLLKEDRKTEEWKWKSSLNKSIISITAHHRNLVLFGILFSSLLIGCEFKEEEKVLLKSSRDDEAIAALADLKALEEGKRISRGMEISEEMLSEKVFIMASSSHFLQDSCNFDFGCDCCEGNIAFDGKGNFYADFLCIEEYDLFFGTYTIKEGDLLLQYNRIIVNRTYNEAYGENDVESKFLYSTDTLQESISFVFKASECGSKQVWRSEPSPDREILCLSLSKLTYKDYLRDNSDLIQRIP